MKVTASLKWLKVSSLDPKALATVLVNSFLRRGVWKLAIHKPLRLESLLGAHNIGLSLGQTLFFVSRLLRILHAVGGFSKKKLKKDTEHERMYVLGSLSTRGWPYTHASRPTHTHHNLHNYEEQWGVCQHKTICYLILIVEISDPHSKIWMYCGVSCNFAPMRYLCVHVCVKTSEHGGKKKEK